MPMKLWPSARRNLAQIAMRVKMCGVRKDDQKMLLLFLIIMSGSKTTTDHPARPAPSSAAKVLESRFKWKPVAEFLCKYFGVADAKDIVPFGNLTYAWELTSETTLGTEMTVEDAVFDISDKVPAESQVVARFIQDAKLLDNPQPKRPFEHPITKVPMPSDLERVCIYGITCRHAKSTMPISVGVRLNYYHSSMSELQDTQEQDKVREAAGGIRGLFTMIHRTEPEGKDLSVIPMPTLHFAYQNDFFCRTMMYIDESNLMNGIVVIPPEVCEAAGLPIFKKMPDPDERMISKLLASMKIDPASDAGKEQAEEAREQWRENIKDQCEGAKPITHFYAIPINHVLAWGFHSEEFMMQRGQRAEQFRVELPGGDAAVLYFLVGSAFFDTLLEGFRVGWMNKVDKRPLNQVAFEFLPILRDVYPDVPADVTKVMGSFSLRSYFTYCSGPKIGLKTQAGLAPALCPGFPSCHQWSPDEVARQLAIDKHMERESLSENLKKT